MPTSNFDVEYIEHLFKSVSKVEVYSSVNHNSELGMLYLIFHRKEWAIEYFHYMLFRLLNERIELTINEVAEDKELYTDSKVIIEINIKGKGLSFKTDKLSYDYKSLHKFMEDISYNETPIYFSCKYYEPSGDTALIKIEDKVISHEAISSLQAFIYSYNPL